MFASLFVGRETRCAFDERRPGEELRGYEIMREIQVSDKARVMLGRRLADDLPVVLKIIAKSRLSATDGLRLIREVGIHLDLLGHSRIVDLYHVIDSPSTVVIVMEYCSGGDMHKFLHEQQGRCLSPPDAREIFAQALEGVAFMHSSGYCHRDIKLENILLTSSRSVKLCDFGFSVEWCPGHYHTESLGTLFYASPEIFMGKYVGTECDMWSLGVTLFAFVTGSLPFLGRTQADVISAVLAGFRPQQCPSFLPIELTHLICRLLCANPDKRVSAQEAMDHAWLRPIRASMQDPARTKSLTNTTSNALLKSKLASRERRIVQEEEEEKGRGIRSARTQTDSRSRFNPFRKK